MREETKGRGPWRWEASRRHGERSRREGMDAPEVLPGSPVDREKQNTLGARPGPS